MKTSTARCHEPSASVHRSSLLRAVTDRRPHPMPSFPFGLLKVIACSIPLPGWTPTPFAGPSPGQKATMLQAPTNPTRVSGGQRLRCRRRRRVRARRTSRRLRAHASACLLPSVATGSPTRTLCGHSRDAPSTLLSSVRSATGVGAPVCPPRCPPRPLLRSGAFGQDQQRHSRVDTDPLRCRSSADRGASGRSGSRTR